MSTRAIQWLRKQGIVHEVIRYEHQEKGVRFAAEATGFALEGTVKTLVVALDDARFVLALMPGDRQLSLRKLAQACGAKRAAMADMAQAERLTGYLVGGISPLGTRRALPVVMESRLLERKRILINGGQRGTMLLMAPGDLQQALNASTAAIAGEHGS